jgi:UDP-glucuronate decarboxylase
MKVDGKKTVAVAGGAGFLGSNLCDRLLEDGFKVICLDNLTTGSTGNILHLLEKEDFIFIEKDIRENFQINCDIVINLASPASPPRYQINPIGTLMINVQGTYNLLELARINKARFIQASTSEIYGDPLEHPQSEGYWGNVNTIGDRSCYDEGKRAAETLCEDFRKHYKMDVTIFRIFNTYGPRMARDDGRVVSNFINQALANDPLTIYGDGSHTRSFCYVDDLIEGFVKVIRSNIPIVGPINLGNPQEFTVLELAEKIINMVGSSSKVIEKKLPNDDPKRRQPNISKAVQILNWEPKINLEEGLIKTIEYFRRKND